MILWLALATGGGLLVVGLITLGRHGKNKDRAGNSGNDGASWSGSDTAASCDGGDGGGGCD